MAKIRSCRLKLSQHDALLPSVPRLLRSENFVFGHQKIRAWHLTSWQLFFFDQQFITRCSVAVRGRSLYLIHSYILRITKRKKSGRLMCRRQGFLVLILRNIVKEAKGSRVALQEVYDFAEDVSHSIIFSVQRAFAQDVVACLELCAVTWAGGILVGEKSGFIFANGGVVYDESRCSCTYGVWQAYDSKLASSFGVGWGNEAIVVVVGVQELAPLVRGVFEEHSLVRSLHSLFRQHSHNSLLGWRVGIRRDLACWSALWCRGHLSSLGQSQNWTELEESLLKNDLRHFEAAIVCPCFEWLNVVFARTG